MTNEEHIATLHESLHDMVRQFLEKASQDGFDIRITDSYRSIEEQNDLYAQGRTKPGNIVTNAKGGQSFHNFGLAIDTVDRQRGYDIDWNRLGDIGKSVGLEWGGDWASFPDRPHFQYTDGLSLQEVQNGARPEVKTNTNDKRMIKLLENRELVWLKAPDANTAEYWVLRDGKYRHSVKKKEQQELASLFGGYGKLRRVEWPEIAGLEEKKRFDLHNQAMTHPERFEAL